MHSMHFLLILVSLFIDMINYIKESNKKAQDRNEYMLFNVPVYVINKFPSNININNILDSVSFI